MVVTSAETVTLLFLASATWKSLRASGLGWLLARTPYVNCDLDDMVIEAGLRGVLYTIDLRLVRDLQNSKVDGMRISARCSATKGLNS